MDEWIDRVLAHKKNEYGAGHNTLDAYSRDLVLFATFCE